MHDKQVWLDTIRGEPHRGVDLRGQRFGELVAVRAVDRNDGAIVWLCRCDCGRVALRCAAQLRRAVKNNQTPMCRLCLSELRHGLYLMHAASAAQRWLEIYVQSGGTLYSADWATTVAYGIIDDLESKGWPRPRGETPASFNVSEIQGSPDCGGQRAAYLVPIQAEPDWVWRCYECGGEFDRGFTCMACMTATCVDCVRDEAHRCTESRTHSWLVVMNPEKLQHIVCMQYPGEVRAFDQEEREARRKSNLMKLVRGVEGQLTDEHARRKKYLKQMEAQRFRASEKQKREHLRTLKKHYPFLFAELKMR